MFHPKSLATNYLTCNLREEMNGTHFLSIGNIFIITIYSQVSVESQHISKATRAVSRKLLYQSLKWESKGKL